MIWQTTVNRTQSLCLYCVAHDAKHLGEAFVPLARFPDSRRSIGTDLSPSSIQPLPRSQSYLGSLFVPTMTPAFISSAPETIPAPPSSAPQPKADWGHLQAGVNRIRTRAKWISCLPLWAGGMRSVSPDYPVCDRSIHLLKPRHNGCCASCSLLREGINWLTAGVHSVWSGCSVESAVLSEETMFTISISHKHSDIIPIPKFHVWNFIHWYRWINA